MSDLFDRLVGGGQEFVRILSCLATIAATHDGFEVDTIREALPGVPVVEIEHTVSQLGAALEQLADAPPFYQFRDNLAPQFLLHAISKNWAFSPLDSNIISLREHAA